jgi:hypothetical protein
MSDHLNRKRLSRLTSAAVLLMLVVVGAVFIGLHSFSQW